MTFIKNFESDLKLIVHNFIPMNIFLSFDMQCILHVLFFLHELCHILIPTWTIELYPDNSPPGQLPTRTIPHQDNSPLGQFSTRTILHKDNSPQGQLPTRTIPHQDNSPLGQTPHQDNSPPWSWWVVFLVGSGLVMSCPRDHGPGG